MLLCYFVIYREVFWVVKLFQLVLFVLDLGHLRTILEILKPPKM